jgi:cellulose synthase/poly-beta-1,6-N-acetylglucosamine synthase-like glycosyltransferase
MDMNVIASIFFALMTPMVVIGFLELIYYPLALSFELRRRRHASSPGAEPWVSIIVPAYNEERVIRNCIESVLTDGYDRKEVFLVDDGSTDGTLAIMRDYDHRPHVTVVSQPNRGKAAALNAGIARASGEILFFVDADGIFTSATIREMLTGFENPIVGAVCGNDEPVNLDRPQTHLLALLTHGTAFVRRALSRVNCLSIVSGNCGAFRRSVVTEIGGFIEGFIGEDLELTWRVHRAGYRVNFRPQAMVYAEVPSTLRALWKQRVRWTRGLIQTARLHKDMMFTSRYGRVGWYLPLNILSTIIFPIVQLVALALLLLLVASGNSPISATLAGTITWAGLGIAMVAVCFALALDRAWKDLRFLYVIPAWAFFSLLLSLVTVSALILEARRAPTRWNKLARTGVVSREAY